MLITLVVRCNIYGDNSCNKNYINLFSEPIPTLVVEDRLLLTWQFLLLVLHLIHLLRLLIGLALTFAPDISMYLTQ